MAGASCLAWDIVQVMHRSRCHAQRCAAGTQRPVLNVTLHMHACGQALTLKCSLPVLQFSSLEPHVCCRLVYVRDVALTTAGITSSAHLPPPAGQQCIAAMLNLLV